MDMPLPKDDANAGPDYPAMKITITCEPGHVVFTDQDSGCWVSLDNLFCTPEDIEAALLMLKESAAIVADPEGYQQQWKAQMAKLRQATAKSEWANSPAPKL